MLGLRKKEGVSIREINYRFSIDFLNKFKSVIYEFINDGLIEISKDRLRLTYKGMDFSNYVIEGFWRE